MATSNLELRLRLAQASVVADAKRAADVIERQLQQADTNLDITADRTQVDLLKRAVDELGDESVQTTRQAKFLKDAYNLSPREIDQVINRMKRLKDETDKTAKSGGNLNSILTGFASAASFAVIQAITGAIRGLGQALITATQQSLELAQAQLQVRAALRSILPTQEAVTQNLQFVRDVADRVGGSYAGLSQEYARFAAAANLAEIAQEDYNAVFEESSRVAAVFGATQADQNLVLNALSQIASKGVVSMEELRQQLGERLPVAFEATARGLNITQAELNELVSSGELTAREFFPAFAAGLQSIGGEINPLTQALGRLNNQFDDASLAIGNALQPIQATIVNLFADISTATAEEFTGFDSVIEAGERLNLVLSNNPEIAERIGEALATLANTAVDELAKIVDGFTALAANEDAVEGIARSIEDLRIVLESLSNTIRFVTALAEGIAALGSEIDQTERNTLRLAAITPAFAAWAIAIENAVKAFTRARDVVVALIQKFDVLAQSPIIQALLDQIVELEAQAGGVGDALAAGLTSAVDALPGRIEQVQDTPQDPGTIEPPEPPDLSPIADKYKQLTATLETETANQKRALIEQGATAEEVAKKDREALSRRITLYEQQLAELRNVNASALDAEGQQTLNNQILALDQQLANDRLKLAQDTRKAKEDEEAKATKAIEDANKAAEQSEKDRQKAAEEAQKAAEQAAKERLDAIEAEQNATERLAQIQVEAAENQLSAIDRVIEGLQRQSSLIEGQLSLLSSVGDLQNTIDDARESRLQRIIDSEESSDSERKKAQRELLDLTAERFDREKEQLEQRQRLELQQFDLEQQRARASEAQAIREEELALTRLGLQRLEIENEIALAQLKGDDRAIEIGQRQIELIDQQAAAQAGLIESLRETADINRESSQGQRQGLLSQFAGQDIALEQSQLSTAQGLAEGIDSRRADRLVREQERDLSGEIRQGDRLAERLLNALENPQVGGLGRGRGNTPTLPPQEMLQPVLSRIDTLNQAILQLAATPRSLQVSTPDPVQDTSRILADISAQQLQEVNP